MNTSLSIFTILIIKKHRYNKLLMAYSIGLEQGCILCTNHANSNFAN